MVLEKLHILTSLFVGLVFTLMGLYFATPPLELAAKLLVTLIVFYFVGLIIRAFLKKALAKPEDLKPLDTAEDKEPIEAE